MKKRKTSSSLTLRLFLTIMLCMLAVNCFTIFMTYRLRQLAEETMIRDHTHLQTMYAEELGRQLTQAQERINSLGRSALADIGTSRTALTDERQYEAVRYQTEIVSAFRNWQIHYPMITGYYLYGRDADVFIFQGTGYESNQWFTAQMNRRGDAQPPLERTFNWRIMDTSFGPILLSNSVRRDMCFGTWVQLSSIWSSLGLNQTPDHWYEIVPEGAAQTEEGTIIDIALPGTPLVLRQVLTEQAMSLPQNIVLIQLLSYFMLLGLPFCWVSMRRLIVRPIQELMHAISEIEQGNTDYRIPEKTTSYEFDRLNRQFNRSIESVANVQAQIYEAKLENERIRIQYLTQQMQPHFVLNTLNLIYSMEPSQYSLMQRMIQCLARYYRYVTHASELLVPVEAELEHVKNYFQLQQYRYPDNFNYDIQCPPELYEAVIPPFVIQTFAENATKHSLVVGEENHVEVHLNREPDGHLHIMIHDSGIGYPAEVLEKIRLFQETRVHQDGLGVGIQNTIERMDLIYEEGADWQFSNAASGGARIDIYLPIMDHPHRMSHPQIL